jgi:hypothetical protein
VTGDLDIVKAGLIERMEDVCAKLLPDGKVEAGQWVSFNPVTGDFRAGRLPSLKIRLRGGVVGAWKDWRSGDAGDALKLVAYILRTDTKGALVWGRDFLGLRSMTRADREGMRKVAAVQRESARERGRPAARAKAAQRRSAVQRQAERERYRAVPDPVRRVQARRGLDGRSACEGLLSGPQLRARRHRHAVDLLDARRAGGGVVEGRQMGA